jgi:hypothetical protein
MEKLPKFQPNTVEDIEIIERDETEATTLGQCCDNNSIGEDVERKESHENQVKKEIVHGGIYESILQFCAIGIMAYLGAYLRVGIMYYRIWKTETNYVSSFIPSIPQLQLKAISHLPSSFSVSCIHKF